MLDTGRTETGVERARALSLMRNALAILDETGPAIAAAALSHAICDVVPRQDGSCDRGGTSETDAAAARR